MKEGVYHQYARLLENHWWTRNRRRLVDRLLRGRKVLPDGSRRVLEIGAGSGTECEYLRSYGQVTAVELSKVGAEYCRGRGYQEVVEGDLNQYQPEAETFDLVVDFNVLYHRWIEDPVLVLSRLCTGLRPGGFLVVSEPAFESLKREHDLVGFGSRRWSRREIRGLVEAAGFELVSLVPYCFALAPLVFGLKQWERLRPKGAEASDIRELEPVSRLTEWLFDAVLGAERALTGWVPLPWGTTWIVVARRPLARQSPLS